jgi:pimeloyl-ACP methyl ester carboxylesterase
MSAFGWRLRLVASLDLRRRLGQIAAPALVLAAPDDRVVPAAAGHDLARRLPAARLLRPRAGHAALIHPRVNVGQFLAEPRHWMP